jgi:hypothetical protein
MSEYLSLIGFIPRYFSGDSSLNEEVIIFLLISIGARNSSKILALCRNVGSSELRQREQKSDKPSVISRMATVTLVHPQEEREVSVRDLINKCSIFEFNVALATAPYRVRSAVSLADFQAFASEIAGVAIEITNANVTGLSLLCGEFDFKELAARLTAFRPSPEPVAEVAEVADAQARVRLSDVEERMFRVDRDCVAHRAKLSQLSCAFVSMRGSMSDLHDALTSHIAEVCARETEMQAQIAALSSLVEGLYNAPHVSPDPDGVFAGAPVGELMRTADGLARLVSTVATLEEEVTTLRNRPTGPTDIADLRTDVAALKASVWRQIDSVILRELPDVFGELKVKRWTLLW